MCTLPKGSLLSLWPGDATFLPKLAPHGLPELTSNTELACMTSYMFPHVGDAGSKIVSWATKPKDPEEAGLHDVREMMFILFVQTFQKVTLLLCCISWTSSHFITP